MTPRDARELAQMCRESRGCNSAILEHIADALVSQADEIDALKAAAIVANTVKLSEWEKWVRRCEAIKAKWKRINDDGGWLSCWHRHDPKCPKSSHWSGDYVNAQCTCGADAFRRLMEE